MENQPNYEIRFKNEDVLQKFDDVIKRIQITCNYNVILLQFFCGWRFSLEGVRGRGSAILNPPRRM